MIEKFFILIFFFIISKFIYGQKLTNPDFELISNKSINIAEGWTSKFDSVTIQIDSLVAYSGKKSLIIKADEINTYKLVQLLSVSYKEFKKYILSAYIKTESIQSGSGYISLLTVNNKGKYGFISNSVPLTGSNNWTKYTIEFYVDSTIKNIIVSGRLKGKGKIWFDNFNIEAISIGKHRFSDKAFSYVNEVFRIIEANSIMKDSVHWGELKKNCFNNLVAQSEVDCYPMIRYIIGKLSDNHSFLKTNQETNNYITNNQVKYPVGKIIDQKYAYLAIYSFESMNTIISIKYATRLQAIIDSLNSLKPCGWIIDLRENPGGNCGPMIAGLGPLIGEGVLAYLLDNKNNKSSISYKNGCSIFNNEIFVKIQGKPLILNDQKPIAVLIGPQTASAGELMALSFIGKKNVKLIGEPSYGATTSNHAFTLSDGATLFLTTKIDLDRNLKRYGDKIIPDILVEFSNFKYNPNEDPVIFKAKEWILLNNK